VRGPAAFGVVAALALALGFFFLAGGDSTLPVVPAKRDAEPRVTPPAAVRSTSVSVSEPVPGAEAVPARVEKAPRVPPEAAGTRDAAVPFEERLAATRAEATKGNLGALLKDWRTGTLAVGDERSLDRAISAWSNDPQVANELDKAVGQLLLAGPDSPEQARALSSHLANAGSELATGYLIEAVGEPKLRSVAASALASVSDPGVLPVFAREIKPSASPELLGAIRGALRNIETPKARDLDARIDELLAR
jgi:hypothetical protein